MKLKNIAIGDFVQVKKSICRIEFEAEEICEVIDIDRVYKQGFDVLIQGKSGLYWVNHKDLKKPIKREPEPQLKQLDQSVFNGLDEKWRFAAVDKCGEAYVYVSEPKARAAYFVGGNGPDYFLFGQGYDTSNWQNSLIERSTAKELTGSDLARAMLARGDTRIMCRVYDIDRQHDITHVIRAYSDGRFHTKDNRWTFAIPINNQGEPLTASEVGL